MIVLLFRIFTGTRRKIFTDVNVLTFMYLSLIYNLVITCNHQVNYNFTGCKCSSGTTFSSALALMYESTTKILGVIMQHTLLRYVQHTAVNAQPVVGYW